MTHARLFAPLDLRSVTLKNRVVVAPMWQYRGAQGRADDWHLMHLGRYADGGAALVFQEGTAVQASGCGSFYDLGIWDDRFIPQLQRITSLITHCGSVPGIQLMHAGPKSRSKTPFEGRGPLERSDAIPDWDEWRPVSASGVRYYAEGEPPREITLPEITETVAAFGRAAARSRLAGYKVIELHAAHGYLIHSFLSPATNKRQDQYGGSFTNRIRFLIEIVEAVRSQWSDDLPLFVRLSSVDGGGWEIEDSVALARNLKDIGVDVIDCSAGGLFGSPMAVSSVPAYGYQVQYAEAVRQAGIKTMAVGLIVHAQHAEDIVAHGRADLVALAREMLYNPAWAADAAQKLGVDPSFQTFGQGNGFWLASRARAKPDLVPSTFGG